MVQTGSLTPLAGICVRCAIRTDKSMVKTYASTQHLLPLAQVVAALASAGAVGVHFVVAGVPRPPPLLFDHPTTNRFTARSSPPRRSATAWSSASGT